MTEYLLTDEEIMDVAYPTMDKEKRRERIGLWGLGILERVAQAQHAKSVKMVFERIEKRHHNRYGTMVVTDQEWEATKQEILNKVDNG